MKKTDSILVLLLAGSFVAAAQEPVSAGRRTGAEATSVDRSSGVVTERQGDSVRTATAPAAAGNVTASTVTPTAPLIGFIDSPSATCFQPDSSQDVCFVNWYYLAVDASPNYMVYMWAVLNPKVVLKVNGFFQTSMYVSGQSLGLGFRVQCGPPVDDPSSCPSPPGSCVPLKVGNSYAYTVRAKDSVNLTSANYGTVTCPAFIP
ncbi:MAG: hypothetical protein IPN83_18470 [Holophagales bacterium]|nr:hypothetical protein [Holophagales bacterium]